MKKFSISLIFLFLSISASADYPDFSDLVDEAAPAVVNVSVIKTISTQNRMSPFNRRQNPFDDFFNFPFPFEDEPRREQEREVRSGGSGFIISKDGYIITNHHVVEDASQIFVSLNDRREFIAELIGSDKKSDVALLKISAKESLPFLDLGDSDDVDVGDWVLAIGSPYRLNFSVTAGIISAKARSVPGQGTSYIPFLQSDVAINPGNSGGPLFNLDGEVIGINAMIYSNRGGYMGISFTIPINYAQEIIDQLREDGFVKRGWLGVSVQEVTKDLADSFGLDVPRGALIGSVLTDSPAESSGLKDGDVIVDFDGNEIIYSGDLPMVVGRISPGEEVKATVYRDGRKKSIRVTVGELEEPEEDSNPIASAPKNNRLGMVVEDFEDIAERRNTDVEKIKENFGVKEGVVVSRVVSGPAFDAGLRRGDVITRIGMTNVSSKTEYENALEDLNNENVIPLRFVRNKNGAFVTIKIKK